MIRDVDLPIPGWQCAALLIVAGAVLLAGGESDAAVFSVNSTVDAVDAVPGDGTCATPAVNEMLLDNFSALSYAGNDGTQDYSGPWTEGGEADGEAAGTLQVSASANCAAGNCLRIGGNNVSINNRTITREANLAGALTATLNYSYRRELLGSPGGSVVLEISSNGGASWTLLTTLSLSASDPAQVPQSANITSFIAPNTQIRARGVGTTASYLYADNVEIAYTLPGPCSLRAAVQEANALTGADVVNLPPNTYTLSLAGQGEDLAATGDLDITDALTVTATANLPTIIDGGSIDRVLESHHPAVTISGVTIRNGVLAGEGGGIRVAGANSLVLRDSAVINNSATNNSGGAIKLGAGSLTLENVTISGNDARDGGAVFNQSGSLTFTNVTITDNTQTTKGAVTPGSGLINFTNTVIAMNNGVTDCDSSVGPGVNNLDSDGSCGFSLTGNPLFGPLQDNGGGSHTHSLAAGSPAIDSGSNGGCPAADQRGVARPIDGDGDLTATCDIGAVEVLQPVADLTLIVTDAPDPAPLNGPLVYSLLVTNNGPDTATGVTVTDTLPPSVNFAFANTSQGSCSGTAVVTCNLGAILGGGTASIEIQVTTTAAGVVSNSASVSADQADPVPGDNSDNDDTTVTSGSSFDVPLTQQVRVAGFLDYTVTGASLRTSDNATDACAVTTSANATVAGIPATATVRSAYLYWSGSGATTDLNVTFDGVPVVADRSFESDFVLGADTYEFFGGFKDVTTQVAGKGNGLYTFADLAVDNGGIYCASKAVIAGWSLIVIYEDPSLSGKSLVLYDGFDLTRNGSTSYVLSGIYASGPPEAKTSVLLWEGDGDLGGASERLVFNGASQSDGLNPANNVYNSTINSLGVATSYGMDLDTFDVTPEVSVGDTVATLQVDTGPDLVILNTAVLQVKTNVIVGTVYEDVNYPGGAGRDLSAAAAAAPAFSVGRPGATVELYDATGIYLRSTTTDAAGEYGFSGLPDADYQVRVVNETVTSSRPGGASGELGVQTWRTDASGSVIPVATEVGGAAPSVADDPANLSSANLGTLTAQSVAPVTISLAVTKTGVDFGFNFDSIVNTNTAGQGSLGQFITNANTLGNANLAQGGLPAGIEHSLFMIPSATDPLGRPPDPNFNVGRGVARLNISAALPAVVAGATAIDGTTQTALVGDTNAGMLGAGGTVGTGPDNVAGTSDDLPLAQVGAPEIELVDGGGLDIGLDLQASDVTVRGVAIFGFGNDPASVSHANIRIDNGNNFTGHVIEASVLGTPADSFNDPGAGARSGASNILVLGADNGSLANNLIGYAAGIGFSARGGAAGWTIDGNEVRANSVFGYNVGDGIALEGAGTGGAVVTGNLVVANGATGIETFGADGAFSLANNTVDGNGAGTGAGATKTAGVRIYGNGSSMINNVVTDNHGAGVMVSATAQGNLISRNSIDLNGASSGQIGIDLLAPADDPNVGTAPFVSANDAGDGDSGGNGLQNWPLLASAVATGTELRISGTMTGVPSTAFTLEFFSSPTADASGNGQGATYLGSDSVSTGAGGSVGFTSVLPIVVPAGVTISATARPASNATSEFSNGLTASSPLAIVKRALHIDGSSIPTGSTVPKGVPFFFLLYINNPGSPMPDVSLRDVLDPAFAYVPGSLRVDASTAACAAAVCTPAEENAIFSAVVATAPLTEALDGDAASFDGPSTTVHAGNASVANAQLDLPAASVLAILFRVTMQ